MGFFGFFGSVTGVEVSYEEASREYEARLRKQAEEFFQIAQPKDEIAGTKKVTELLEKAFRLQGDFVGCIRETREHGHEADPLTLEYYKKLSDFTEQYRNDAV